MNNPSTNKQNKRKTKTKNKTNQKPNQTKNPTTMQMLWDSGAGCDNLGFLQRQLPVSGLIDTLLLSEMGNAPSRTNLTQKAEERVRRMNFSLFEASSVQPIMLVAGDAEGTGLTLGGTHTSQGSLGAGRQVQDGFCSCPRAVTSQGSLGAGQRVQDGFCPCARQ